MRIGFYPKLAIDGITKNKSLYFPYILTSICMVMMEYIIMYLGNNEYIKSIPGGQMLSVFITLGIYVIGLFSILFLFYSNSFLMKKRKKEFGLYNILGMGKRHISLVILWENFILYLTSVVGGLVLGISFSKFAELGLLRLSKLETNLDFNIPTKVVLRVCVFFFVVFFLLLMNALRQVKFSSAINLLKSENVGDKPPKSNWIIGVLGFVILAIAYYLAVSVNNSISAIEFFFIAVLLVIIATYLIMIFGSIVICKILKNNKKYYYKSNHYVAVSSMMYRMRRNGAGLASICILSTMVLVMISSTSCLYFGEERLLNTRNPRQVVVGGVTNTDLFSDAEVMDYINGLTKECGVESINEIYYTDIDSFGAYKEGIFYFDPDSMENPLDVSKNGIVEFIIITVDEYNRINNANESLAGNNVFIYSPGVNVNNEFTIYEAGLSLNVVKTLDECPLVSAMGDAVNIAKPVYIVVGDNDVFAQIASIRDSSGVPITSQKFEYYYDITGGVEKETEIVSKILNDEYINGVFTSYNAESKEESRIDFYSSFGGLFYLGIVLSIVFILASVLIIYYKQISEGYEDQVRFEIMQKVGMTKKEIKNGINSQLLTVFFLPLVGALLHVSFAFPMIQKLLALFNLRNPLFFATTTAISFIIFAVFYTIVYKLTSNSYYKIVSSKI